MYLFEPGYFLHLNNIKLNEFVSIVQKSYACPWAFSCFRSFSFQHTSSIICMNGASSFPRFHHKAHIWSNTFIYYKNSFQFFSCTIKSTYWRPNCKNDMKICWKCLTCLMIYILFYIWNWTIDINKPPYLNKSLKKKIATFKTQNGIA